MNKIFLALGTAAAAISMLVTGCASTQEDPAAYTKEVLGFLNGAKGLETHEKQAEKYVLPNVLLENSRVLYTQTGDALVESIKLRYGEADYLLTCRDAFSGGNAQTLNKLRGADSSDKDRMDAELKLTQVIAQSWEKNKAQGGSISKKDTAEVCKDIIGLQAREDYIKNHSSKTPEEEKIACNKQWEERAVTDVKRIAKEEAALQAKAQAKLEAAKKDADEANKKVALVVKYWSAKAAFIVAEGQAKAAANEFVRRGFDVSAQAAAKLMTEAETEWPGCAKVFEMPALSANPSLDELQKTADAINKELQPYSYSLKIAGERFAYTGKAIPWWIESNQNLSEAAGE